MNCYENIPAELKKLNQWVCTRGNSKVPMKAWENEAASSTNPQTWADFDTAHKSVSDGHYDYCGFVFNDNGFVGVDMTRVMTRTDFFLLLRQILSANAEATRRNPRVVADFIFCSKGTCRSRARTISRVLKSTNPPGTSL